MRKSPVQAMVITGIAVLAIAHRPGSGEWTAQRACQCTKTVKTNIEPHALTCVKNITSGLWTSAEPGRSWEGGCVIGGAQWSHQLMAVPATGESRRRIVFGEFRRLRGQFVLSRRCPDSWLFAKMLRRRQVTKTVFVSHHESI